MMYLDLHGYSKSEAEIYLDLFLKECILKNVSTAKISHGYGNLILKNMVHLVLKENQDVQNFEFAHPNDGGAGITLIYFKK